MKRFYFSILISSFFISYIQTDENCMDNSKHTDTCDGFDYKKYYYVNDCYCPCNRYQRSFKRLRCERCLHFNVEREQVMGHYACIER